MSDRSPRWASLNCALDRVRDGSLSGSAHYVLLILAVYYADDQGEAWPTQSTLAAATGLSQPTVRRAVRELQQHSLMTVRKGPPAHTYGNVYTLQNPVDSNGLPDRNPKAAFGFRPKRQSVTAKPCEASGTTPLPLSEVGDLVLTCSSDHRFRVSRDLQALKTIKDAHLHTPDG